MFPLCRAAFAGTLGRTAPRRGSQGRGEGDDGVSAERRVAGGLARATGGSAPVVRGGPGPWQSRVERLFITAEFGAFSLGSFPSAMGGWMQTVALGWLVASLGGSALWLGLLTFATMGPLLVAPFGGAFVDRLDRRRLLFCVTAVQMGAALVLTAMAFAGRLSLPLILLLAFVGGAPNALGWPAWSAFIADLVPARSLRQAVAVNSARFNLTRVVGPALAGLLLARAGPQWCLAVAWLGTAIFCCTLAFLRPRHKRPHGRPEPVLRALASTARYVARDRSVVTLLVSVGAVGLLVLPYTSFLPRFAKDVLNQGPEALGLLLTAGGCGAVAGAALSGSRLVAARPRLAALVLHLLTCASALGLALAPTLHVAAGFAVLLGFSSTAYLAVVNATLQITAPPGMLGRLLGFWVVVNAGSVPVGGLVLGSLATAWGLRPVEAVAALAAVSAAAGLWPTRRALAADPPRAPDGP